MKKFFFKVTALLFIVFIIGTICLLLPPTNLTRKFCLFAQIDKNSLLQNTPGQRMILVGGSNVSFGFNCQIIKDSLHINPVNTAYHAGIGLKYMLENTIRFVRENDIVVVAPEYHQFYGNLADGGDELLTVLIDVTPQATDVSFTQYIHLVRYFPKYASSKLRLWLYLTKPDAAVGVYDRKSFNAYGDAYMHWKLPRQSVASFDPINGDLNDDAFKLLEAFRKMISIRKAHLFVTFPCYQDVSFKRSFPQIQTVQRKLIEGGFDLLGTPERYMFPDSLTFDTPYHLIKKGVDYRTTLLVEDLQKRLRKADDRTGILVPE